MSNSNTTINIPTTGLRYNTGKNKLSLIPPRALKEIGKVFTYGANKFTVKDNDGKTLLDGSNNWKKGLPWVDVLDSARRHIEEYAQGIDHDHESGIYHLAHACTNLIFLLEYYNIYPEGDNRPHLYLKPKRIGWDVDGTIADFDTAFMNRVRKAGFKVPDNFVQLNWNYPYEWWDALWEGIQKDKSFWVDEIQPKILAADLKYEPILYATARTIPTEWTQQWIVKHGFPPKPIHSSGIDSKIKVLQENKIDLFIDDSYSNFVDLNANNILTYLLDNSYNQKYNVGYKRIKTVNDVNGY